MTIELTNLSGHLLVATPKNTGLHSFQAVAYITEHTAHTVRGLVVNKPMGIPVENVLEHLGCSGASPAQQEVMVGGPCGLDQGSVLHRNTAANQLPCLTSSTSDLNDIIQEEHAPAYVFALGHMSWSTDELSAEILDNIWHVVFLNPKSRDTLLFNVPSAELWSRANDMIDYRRDALSLQVGHA